MGGWGGHAEEGWVGGGGGESDEEDRLVLSRAYGLGLRNSVGNEGLGSSAAPLDHKRPFVG